MTRHRIAAVVVVCAAATVLALVAGANEREDGAVEYKTVFVPSVAVSAKQLGESEVEVDGARFAREVDIAVRRLADEGFEVTSTIPVISGMYRWSKDQSIKRSQSASAYGYGYGYSVTAGVTIIARRG